ncbi:MAG TPA: HIT domain-containing protein [bacterium]|nr:HIT domain-containing protein [bacterium]
MRQLWAPWRLEYIQGQKPGGCFLCAAAGSADDEAALVVYRGFHCFVVLNRFPYNAGHVMVVPKAHRARIADLEDADALEVLRLVDRTIEVMDRVFHAEGYNVGLNLGRAAGAGVEDHVHMHVVPRWAGDTNFMPVLGDVKVMPEHLRTTRQRLAQGFAALPAQQILSAPEQG